mmetsp:Transcript_31209/g.74093  ORF Transcript_31209/g.74093 Transcript_31209/m.74093 type:complete len:269 (+) Transcript_31209:690-1496(+)
MRLVAARPFFLRRSLDPEKFDAEEALEIVETYQQVCLLFHQQLEALDDVLLVVPDHLAVHRLVENLVEGEPAPHPGDLVHGRRAVAWNSHLVSQHVHVRVNLSPVLGDFIERDVLGRHRQEFAHLLREGLGEEDLAVRIVPQLQEVEVVEVQNKPLARDWLADDGDMVRQVTDPSDVLILLLLLLFLIRIRLSVHQPRRRMLPLIHDPEVILSGREPRFDATNQRLDVGLPHRVLFWLFWEWLVLLFLHHPSRQDHLEGLRATAHELE